MPESVSTVTADYAGPSHRRGLAAPITENRRFLPSLLVLFVGSGCAALIYEIVWFQLLELVIGASGISIGVLLATFMGGMCIGSLLLARVVGVDKHPLRVYALLEVGIALCGILVLFGVPLIGRLYTQVGGGFADVVLRAVVCALALLPPTILMGATLPLVARWIGTSSKGVSWVGFLYGSNTAGAVFGCLLAGFYLLRIQDMRTATFAAAALNLAVAGVAWYLTRSGKYTPVAESRTFGLADVGGMWPVYVAIALSGLTALGSQVIWTRLLSLLFGASVYTFSIILAVFLVGLGLGSAAGSMIGRLVRPWVALAWVQLLQVLGIAWAGYMIAESLPFWPINPSLSTSPWFNFQLDIVRCTWAILPASLLWGASFPLALAAAASRGGDPGRVVGGIYAANTVGAIVGALIVSTYLIPGIGTQDSQRLLVAITVVSALVLFVPLLRGTVGPKGERVRALGPGSLATIGVGLLLAVMLGRGIAEIPPGLVAYGRYMPTYAVPNLLYIGEGMNSTVAVSELSNGVRNFHVSGKIEASSEPQDMRLQRMLGHLSALLHPNPKSVLIVGFGAGVTAGSFVTYPGIERIVICELEPLIPGVVSRYFRKENYDVLNDPRVEVVFDDARHYILTTDEKFDIITSDPIHPWVKGAATLYTREYFELVKRHLNPGGLISQWVPLYESTPEVIKSEMATFFEVFPTGTIWSNDINGQGYDLVVVGQAEPTRVQVDSLLERLGRPDHARVVESVSEVGFGSTFDLLRTYAGQGQDLKPWYDGAPINRDSNLRLQYLAGLGLNLYQNAAIYEEMLRYRQFPEELFVTTPERKAALREVIGPR